MIKELTKKCFEECPVWSWDESEEYHCLVNEYKPLPADKGTLFLKAIFTAPNKKKFDGYLIGIDNFYAFGLFVNKHTFIFNLNLQEMFSLIETQLFNEMGCSHFPLFPMVYETELSFEGKNNISGIISLNEAQ